MAKQVIFGEEVRQTLKRGIDALADDSQPVGGDVCGTLQRPPAQVQAEVVHQDVA